MIRDTDADWRRIAEGEPYCGVLSQDIYRRQNLDDAVKAVFFESSERPNTASTATIWSVLTAMPITPYSPLQATTCTSHQAAEAFAVQFADEPCATPQLNST